MLLQRVRRYVGASTLRLHPQQLHTWASPCCQTLQVAWSLLWSWCCRRRLPCDQSPDSHHVSFVAVRQGLKMLSISYYFILFHHPQQRLQRSAAFHVVVTIGQRCGHFTSLWHLCETPHVVFPSCQLCQTYDAFAYWGCFTAGVVGAITYAVERTLTSGSVRLLPLISASTASTDPLWVSQIDSKWWNMMKQQTSTKNKKYSNNL